MAGRQAIAIFVVIMLCAALFGLLTDNGYWLRLGIYVGIYSVVTIGLNLLFGNAGQISLGHAGFFAIGAYASAVLTKNAHVPFLAAMLLSALLVGAVGLLIGYAALRLKGHYLGMATLAFGMIVFGLLVEVPYLGSTSGIIGIPPISVLGFDIVSPQGVYLFAWTVVAIVYGITLSLLSSRVGRALVAIREDEVAAATMGIPVARYKIQVFTISAMYTGLAGSIYAGYMALINPFSFNVELSITVMLMIVVGGLGSVPGSVLGATILTILPELGRDFENYRLAGYGLLLVLLILFVPKGLTGALTALWEMARGTTRRREPSMRSGTGGLASGEKEECAVGDR